MTVLAPITRAQNVFLDAYLEPFQPWLERDDVSEILVNCPGEIWIEAADKPTMQRIALPVVDDLLLRRLAEQIARATHQGINRQRPLLGATLPNGARVQFIGPPATRRHWAMAIRRHRVKDVDLEVYRHMIPGPTTETALPFAEPLDLLRAAVKQRRTILVSGGTSTGKTTFLNALLRDIPMSDRIVLVEDTPEIKIRSANALGLVSVKGQLGEAHVTIEDLLQAALRLRPDRIILGELRGNEAITFLRAINTGHPGSFSTIHANSAAGALEQLALMVMQAGLGLSRRDTLIYAASVIDVVVQLGRDEGRRGIVEVRSTRSLVEAAIS